MFLAAVSAVGEIGDVSRDRIHERDCILRVLESFLFEEHLDARAQFDGPLVRGPKQRDAP